VVIVVPDPVTGPAAEDMEGFDDNVPDPVDGVSEPVKGVSTTTVATVSEPDGASVYVVIVLPLYPRVTVVSASAAESKEEGVSTKTVAMVSVPDGATV
jgi:hypothetical protein